MAQQARAIRTRQAILEAAAAVFADRGYERATVGEILVRAGVTKGALYFHFASKEDLALGVLAAQMLDEPLPPHPLKLQELVDQGLILAYRIQHEPVVRASVALALDTGASGIDRAAPFETWIAQVSEVLAAARDQGELLPHVDIEDTAELFSGAYAGIQTMSSVLRERRDLIHRVVVFFEHLLPSICTPVLLTRIDISEGRALELAAAYAAQQRRSDDDTPADSED
ncbi:ScbR family autoregulator-binding transcription factor [Streptomyces sp. NPDC020807]|uniref:ScbR family autoregulator-binding transcription factor n=1 Tax=Streptomyces sp. NPDC020807 TaxID=3155119 RepID=UPI0033F35A7D